MRLHKTDLARSALGERPGSLGVRDRRILILSDGQRSLEDIAALLGADARGSVDRLVQDGYLRTSERPDAAPAATRSFLGGLQQAAAAVRLPSSSSHRTTASAAAPATAQPAASAVAAAPAAAGLLRPAARRSIAATKMYVLDMLQLQRDPEAVSLKAAVQASVGQDAILASVVSAVAHLQRVSSDSYGRRVYERVAEIIPEEALALLQAQCRPPALT